MSHVLGVSRSGYYAFIKAGRSKRDQANDELTTKIKASYQESRQTYGSPCIQAELKLGLPCVLTSQPLLFLILFLTKVYTVILQYRKSYIFWIIFKKLLLALN